MFDGLNPDSDEDTQDLIEEDRRAAAGDRDARGDVAREEDLAERRRGGAQNRYAIVGALGLRLG